MGSKGTLVTMLQQRLNLLGYSLTADGDFGPHTRDQVVLFQRVNNLTPNGIVNGATWAVLNSDSAKKAPSAPVVAAPRTVEEYQAKYDAASILPQHMTELQTIKRKQILLRQTFYAPVSESTKFPWKLIACIHERESSLRTNTYLQNGDPLFNSDGKPIPTVDVPAGVGPFDPQTWSNAAIQALGGPNAGAGRNWSIGEQLKFAEEYNGIGYRNRGVSSPYDWSYTDQYSAGKFTKKLTPKEMEDIQSGSLKLTLALPEDGPRFKDHHWNPNLVDQQAGVAAMLKMLADQSD